MLIPTAGCRRTWAAMDANSADVGSVRCQLSKRSDRSVFRPPKTFRTSFPAKEYSGDQLRCNRVMPRVPPHTSADVSFRTLMFSHLAAPEINLRRPIRSCNLRRQSRKGAYGPASNQSLRGVKEFGLTAEGKFNEFMSIHKTR